MDTCCKFPWHGCFLLLVICSSAEVPGQFSSMDYEPSCYKLKVFVMRCASAAAGMALWCGLTIKRGCCVMPRKCTESGRLWLVSVILSIVCVCTLPEPFLSLCSKLTHFFVCLHYTASKRHRLSVWTPPIFLVFLCTQSRRDGVQWPRRRHPHIHCSLRGAHLSQLWQVSTPSPTRRPSRGVPGILRSP